MCVDFVFGVWILCLVFGSMCGCKCGCAYSGRALLQSVVVLSESENLASLSGSTSRALSQSVFAQQTHTHTP